MKKSSTDPAKMYLRPIIFSGEMVRAILENRKSQTRRIVKPQPDNIHDGEPYWSVGGYRAYQKRGITDPLRMGAFNPLLCPYGEVLDKLWVRETWAAEFGVGDDPIIQYRASGDQAEKWKPSIFMPRRASRITLEITNIRVERLQDISVEDALAEGVSSVAEYIELWKSINKSWEPATWIWVIQFRKL